MIWILGTSIVLNLASLIYVLYLRRQLAILDGVLEQISIINDESDPYSDYDASYPFDTEYDFDEPIPEPTINKAKEERLKKNPHRELEIEIEDQYDDKWEY